MTSDEGKPITQNGWKSAAGIKDALRMGNRSTPSLDSFFDIDPLLAPPIPSIQPQAVMEEILPPMGLLSCDKEDDDFNDDDALVMEGEDITGERNAFDVFVGEDDDL